MRCSRLLAIGLIAGVTLLVYASSLGNSFVRWDDSMLIYENPIVREISWKSLKSAFTTYDPELYIPLTFLSYQIDYAIGGMHPFLFHLTSLVLHILNAILVYVFMTLLLRWCHSERSRGTTRSNEHDSTGFDYAQPDTLFATHSWIPLFVALLFALHPLNTEAVAWASGRKDVLSTFFFLGSLCTYLKWRESCVTLSLSKCDTTSFDRLRMTQYWYWLSVIAFLFGLLSKVMVLTLPVILLLLERYGDKPQRGAKQYPISNIQFPRNFPLLPFFFLSILFGIVGLFGKESALGASTLWEKFLMAPKSAVFYLEKLLWPSGLSVLYPYVGTVSICSADFVVPLLLFLLLISVATWLWFRWKRASIGLWFFLITVVPTFLNFAKGGDMDRYFASDRYAYIPSIGIFLFLGVVTVAISEHIQWTVSSRWTARLGAALCIAVLGYRAHAQAKLWGSTELLLQNVLTLYGDSSHVAHNNMGNVYRLRGDLPRALEEYKQALAIRPHSKTLANLGATYRRLHQYPEAREAYQKALELNPKNPEVSVGLGLVALEMRKLADARKAFIEAIADDPRSEEAYVNLGALAMREGKTDEAIEHYRKALAANPYFTQAHYNLAVALSAEKRGEEAIGEYEAALQGDPSLLAARINLGILYYNTGRRSDALAQFRVVLQQDPGNATAREALRQIGLP